MIEAGKTLQQRYRIDRQIGLGGMGAVYVATDERFGSMVAIKKTLCMDDNYRHAIEREARLLNSLKHQALPRVSDHFVEEDGQFLVMEYIPGEDLAHMLESSGEPFPVERVLAWAHQLLDALEFLHTQSTPVIHRDIKPQNLKLTASDQIVLLDFGLAKGNPTDAGFQTAAKSIFGYSRNYASLEQIQGTGTDPRSDLYSLAATLYHLVAGQPPEDALTRAMAVLSNQPDPLVRATAVNPNVPPGFAEVLHRALALNAASRPASAYEMRTMLGEMDTYENLASRAIPSLATVPNAGASAHKTHILPGRTGPGGERRSGVETELLPAYNSEETAIRQIGQRSISVSTDEVSPARGPLRRLLFVGAGLLLLFVGLTAGAYVLDPSIFSESTVEPVPVPPVQVAEPPLGIETVPEVLAEDGPAGEAGSVGSTETGQDIRKATAGPSERENSPSRPPAASTNEDDVVIDGERITVGNIRIRENRRVETDDVIIDDDGITPKEPNVPPVPSANYPDTRRLTPNQRRRLRELRRRGIIPPARQTSPREQPQERYN
ncbi:MAG: serine/threonine-protein kinase [Pyrinomonadaceae bacterium]